MNCPLISGRWIWTGGTPPVMPSPSTHILMSQLFLVRKTPFLAPSISYERQRTTARTNSGHITVRKAEKRRNAFPTGLPTPTLLGPTQNQSEWFEYLERKGLRTFLSDHPYPVARRDASAGLQTSKAEVDFRWVGLSTWMAKGSTWWWFDAK